MADVKISQLPAATTPLAGTEEIPLVQGSTTKQVTVSNLLTAANLGTPTAINLTNATNVPVNQATGILPVANGGNGTATPSIVGGTNISVSGTWPNQTISATGAASGNVTGPSSATDNAVVRFDNTTGQVIQNSNVIINDTGEITAGTWKATPVAVAYGGTGTTTPSLVAGTNVTISGTWPNQTINSSGGSGGVTSVTGTAPVVSSGGTTPAISMAAATASVSGYLTSTDWNTFNNKQPAGSYLTSGGALGTPSSGTATNLTGLPLSTGVTGTLPVANGGTGTTTPSIVAGTNVTVTGTWPNQTINATGGGGGSGTVTSASVVSANGFAGTVANATTTPAITLSTSITGVLKGNGTALSAATAGTDYVAPGGALGTPSSGTATNLTGLPLSTGVTGTLPIANGGSGQTTAQTAMNAFAGATTSGSYLRGNGTNVVMATIQAADVPTLNQNTTGTAANITATSNATITTLSSLSLPGSQVSGNISGNAANVTGTVAIANGGTGQTTANTAFNALAPSQSTNSGKYLTTDGTNTSWATVAAGASTSTANTWTATQTFNGTSSTFGAVLTDTAETVNVVGSAPSATTNLYVQSGSVQYYTSNAANNFVVNLAFSSGTSMNTALATGQSVTAALVTTQGSTAYYATSIQVDGTTSGVTTKWIGGAPTAGNASGLDTYRFSVIKVSSGTYIVLASLTQFK